MSARIQHTHVHQHYSWPNNPIVSGLKFITNLFWRALSGLVGLLTMPFRYSPTHVRSYTMYSSSSTGAHSNAVFAHGGGAPPAHSSAWTQPARVDHAAIHTFGGAPPPTIGIGGGAMNAHTVRHAAPPAQSNPVFAHGPAMSPAHAAQAQLLSARNQPVPWATRGTGGGAMNASHTSRHGPSASQVRRGVAPARVAPYAAAGNHRRDR